MRRRCLLVTGLGIALVAFGSWTLSAARQLPLAPARLENFQPHMHMRGKAMSMEAIYPDGRRELLSLVD
ncbi:MAG: hypothetical protein ACE5HV_13725, partial [Acidobacteriota bacterium]